MKQLLEDARKELIEHAAKRLGFDDRQEFSKLVAKKYLDYAFSKEFVENVEREHYRNLHPALKDLHDQYLEMETLLKKEEQK